MIDLVWLLQKSRNLSSVSSASLSCLGRVNRHPFSSEIEHYKSVLLPIDADIAGRYPVIACNLLPKLLHLEFLLEQVLAHFSYPFALRLYAYGAESVLWEVACEMSP